MQNAGQGSEKKSYRVILLLVVGLAAFTTAMRELNQVQELTVQTSNLFAEWSAVIAPAEKTVAPVKVETCENRDIPAPPSAPVTPVEPASAPEPAKIITPLPPAPPKIREAPAVKPKRPVRPDHDSVEVRVLTTDDFIEKSIKEAFTSDAALKAFKAKNRRHLFITPDGRDVLLKTLNRSINLRSAS